MTDLSWVVAPPPKTYFADLFGRPASGGQLFTRSNINPTINKPVYLDQYGPDGQGAWSNPIIIDATGSQGPFYWQIDADNGDDTYFLEFYDEDDNLIWTITDFLPTTGSGGGGTAGTRVVENILVNNVFWHNNFTSTALTIPNGGTSLSSASVLAPGAHSSMYHPEIFFWKNNGTGTETIQFVDFPNGDNSLTPDNTPEQYAQYICSVASGATRNGMFIPITSNLKTLENQTVTVSIYAKVMSGANQLVLNWYQFAGTGGAPSADVITPIGTALLDATWTKYQFPITVPLANSVVTQGTNGNAQLLLYIQLPSDPSTIQFTKPAIFLGLTTPQADFQSHDKINSVIASPRTGDIRQTLNHFTPFGWVKLDDTTIGNSTSLASQRANNDTFYLYRLLWNSVSDTYAPVSTGRGLTADADFAAGKTMQLLYSLGASLGNIGAANAVYAPLSGTSYALGQYSGQELHTLTTAEMPAHTHDYATPNALGGTIVAGAGLTFQTNTTTSVGGGAAHNTIHPTLRVNYFMKL